MRYAPVPDTREPVMAGEKPTPIFRCETDLARLPASDRIRYRLVGADCRYHANDNIAEFIAPGELESLLDEVEVKMKGVLESLVIDLENDHNTGNTARQTAAQILQSNIAAVNDKFIVEVTGLPWPTFLQNQRALKLPVFFSGWVEDLHDPHNWTVPYTIQTYGGRQSLPDDLKAQFKEIINRGVSEADPDKRAEIYHEFNDLYYETAPIILLATSQSRHYEQRWVEGYFWNPIYPGNYFYTFSKK